MERGERDGEVGEEGRRCVEKSAMCSGACRAGTEKGGR